MRLTGTVRSGRGFGTVFTQLDWFVAAAAALGGFEPVAGTLNVQVDDVESYNKLLLDAGTPLVPPSSEFCCALLLGANLSRASGTGGEQACAGLLVRPLTPGYCPAQAEVVAGVQLRRTLGLRDGDRVVLQLEALAAPRWVQPATVWAR